MIYLFTKTTYIDVYENNKNNKNTLLKVNSKYISIGLLFQDFFGIFRCFFFKRNSYLSSHVMQCMLSFMPENDKRNFYQ